MFRELSRLIEVATELAGQTGLAAGSAVVDVRTRIGTLRHETRRPTVVREAREPLVDIFNEEDHYHIVAELRGVDRESVQWRIDDNRTVVIQAAADRRTYYRAIELGTAVDATTAVASFDNGVLELRVWKQ
jgi:HSP20 family protein